MTLSTPISEVGEDKSQSREWNGSMATAEKSAYARERSRHITFNLVVQAVSRRFLSLLAFVLLFSFMITGYVDAEGVEGFLKNFLPRVERREVLRDGILFS